MSKVCETVLEIDLRALKRNATYLKSKLQPDTKFLAVVKAFSYGNDSEFIASYLEKEVGVDYFAVAYTSEGVALRKAGIKSPILVLHPQSINFDELIAFKLEPSIYSSFVLNAFIAEAEKKGLNKYPIHLKFNTGLNRLGFSKSEISYVVGRLNASSSVYVHSIFSHLAASEDMNEIEFSKKQINCFVEMAQNLESKIGYNSLWHMCNTSGILNYPEAHFNMVRSGIGLYGFGNDPKFNSFFTPIGSLKTIISQIHEVLPGESLGYNRGFIAHKKTRSATLPLGHADGIGRQYGNGKGYVIINHKKARILGNVCMDMLMVDVTDITCKEGDEVLVFGLDPTAEDLAATTGTISYELITGISQRVKRVFIT
ncbi:alanine racemase [Imtechella halotolerans]|uniref:Alanine racemase n=1 Tax=Imtechella halotolerans K1 TaxID=946077 RepID=I0WJK5_9FLAO|nr:alanine racemase [Imtechella halotolerans]EID76571.1 alanine racemase [Imtechella halotolerans K1]WMQ62858.1 alanine racemase [Imtechella halotolerans]